ILFAVFCRYYQALGDFVQQGVRQRISDGLLTLDAAMFRSFLLDQEATHPEVAELSDSTREKLATVAIRVLREAGILLQRKRTEPGELQRPKLSEQIHERYCREGRREDYGHLLWSEEEISRCMT
ncbi:MAG: BrxA family protein, partial [Alkalispirochaetaceae bacterium]